MTSTTGAFGTDLDTMPAVAGRVEEVAAQLRQRINTLDGRIQPIAATWQGTTAMRFMTLHERLVREANALDQVLAEIAAGIRANGANYADGESVGSAAVSRVESLLL